MARQEDCTVMLSAAMHLDAHADRPFAAAQGDNGTLRGTTEPCHAARGEASRRPCRQTLRSPTPNK